MAAIAPTRIERGYSRFVAVMKVALPLGAAAVIILLFSWSRLYDMPKRLQIGATSFSVSESTSGHRMINARYTGTDRNDNPYTLAAESIVQQKLELDRVTLNRPEADFTTADGTWVAVAATRGAFVREAQRVELRGNVSLYHDWGYQFLTDEATIDFAQATAWGDAPVNGTGTWADMEAAGFRITRQDSRLEFSGPARLVLYSNPKEQRP